MNICIFSSYYLFIPSLFPPSGLFVFFPYLVSRFLDTVVVNPLLCVLHMFSPSFSHVFKFCLCYLYSYSLNFMWSHQWLHCSFGGGLKSCFAKSTIPSIFFLSSPEDIFFFIAFRERGERREKKKVGGEARGRDWREGDWLFSHTCPDR